MRVLLLEDNRRLNNTIVKHLEVKGYVVDSFEDGTLALENAYEGYDCFILYSRSKNTQKKILNY